MEGDREEGEGAYIDLILIGSGTSHSRWMKKKIAGRKNDGKENRSGDTVKIQILT